ncbi:SusC/RagA family TonB-linked outer membrane protein [Gelidibacter sp. F63206]|uniref:SusC/RagA family TonB-linked outer membrane protein n=1 Tax=Gelidibacter sp. F63206 TaxID=2926425 RepID=UPI001FF3EF25|nr:SusC/RagA family TonB-linked outer membrane protein [Gelidibacter sp. F63206]MCK0115239.1 SusC/RagA family TonB-linked outer membrane protein [Gelidibacter sp. F63206]
MQIKLTNTAFLFRRKLLMAMMRTFIFLCCATVFSLTPNNVVSQNSKINIVEDKTLTVDQVFGLIMDQTDYNFIYEVDLFKDFPTIQVKKGIITTNKLLQKSLSFKDLDIVVTKDNTIIVKQKPLKNSLQQDFVVTGKVTDGNLPISGANVLIKNTNRGVVTDFDGQYSITARPTDSLKISYLGYTTLTIPIENRTIINVTLQEDATALEEVQINAGYYSTTDREKTGSIARITTKDIEKQPVSNPLAAMQGRMAGVHITQSTGVPGGGFDIQIRGKNSLRTDGNAPLYIVDGIPFGTENIGDTSISGGILPSTRGGLSPLNSINPADIESIEVLKDADATAIYGSRGANGVVLITTKKGKEGKTNFNINTYTGVGNVTRKLKLMHTEQYLAMREQALSNDGFTKFPPYANDVNGNWDRNRYTDWQSELIGGTAYSNSVQTSISGGSVSTRFLISATHYKETTVFPGDFKFRKTAANFNVNHISDNKKFEASLSGNYISDQNNLLATDLTRQAYILAPNAPEPYNLEGKLNWENSTWNNPYRLLEEKYLAKNNNLIANSTLIYRPFDNWELKTSLGFTDSSLQESKASPHTIYNPAYGYNSEMSTLLLNDAKLQSSNFEPQLSFKQEILDGLVSILVGATFQNSRRTQSGLYGWGFSNNNLINNITAASNIQALSSNNSEYRYSALFGRINFSYSDKYFINLTGRRDGSSRFGPEKRFANFGAVGLAWIFTKGKFFEEKIEWLSFGKLRGSFGTTGSDRIGDYQFLNTYSLSGNSYEGVVGLEPTQLFNPDFSWETNKKTEGAIELGFFNDRLYLSTAYYRNRASNQLVGIPLPATTGFPLVTANLDATVENTGWEFELEGKIANNDNFKWTTSLNLTLPKNKLISFPNLEGSTYSNKYVIGQPLDIHRVYHFIGVNQQTGIYEFEDYDEDERITAANDRMKLVQTTPNYYGGLQNSFSYKNWQLDFLFQFVKQLGNNYNSFGVLPGIASNLPIDFANPWQQPGDESSIQLYTTGLNYEATTAYFRFLSSDRAFSDASFIRLKNISLSYTLPIIWPELTSCRIYMQGQNLFTLTTFKGADPENQSSMNLPPLRVFSMGVELKF